MQVRSPTQTTPPEPRRPAPRPTATTRGKGRPTYIVDDVVDFR